jgi:hypothetical protein
MYNTDAEPQENWLLLLHRLPTRAATQRVKLWRRLSALGALPLQRSVHVLPRSVEALESLEWLRGEIAELGGDATIFYGGPVDPAAVPALKEAAMRRAGRGQKPPQRASSSHAKASCDPGQFTRRVWVTRPRPGVDRMSSAWLIRRFIDRDAIFTFAADPHDAADAVPFDMYGTGFTHEGNRCTFEVLAKRFHVVDAGVRRISHVVHDIDLNDDRYGDAHTATVAAMVDGLRAAARPDSDTLEDGIRLFESLFAGLSRSDGKPKRPMHKPTKAR